ncbi:hypothetical protein KIN20_024243 [Parelaphostrongylus tenuis]|uniref:Dolichyl-diphosphooligosaccharide--protein glycosyltransferase subunit 2 n=1 Tax=Parelaphostrongylus tenuis TaxID=148309 RepID=A0AAD5MWR7_PARTN|nr:hypothetical protein KIN20_024239 [Parelaphostrongylus tenuis]KAJ1364212.1 hypothetical protein KIN20_024243 [Parelaphostrongylus tenuis]
MFQPFKDSESHFTAYRATSNLTQDLCEISKKADLAVPETLYHASALSSDLPNCTINRITEAQVTIENVLVHSNPNGEKITQALRSADRLGLKVNKAAFDKLLETSMKADDSPNK